MTSIEGDLSKVFNGNLGITKSRLGVLMAENVTNGLQGKTLALQIYRKRMSKYMGA